MDFIATVQTGQIVLSLPQAVSRKHWLSTLKDGTCIKETLTKVTKSKTHQQVKAYFGLALNVILSEFEDRGWDTSILLGQTVPTGVSVSKGLLKEYLYAACCPCDDDGNLITISSEKMDTIRQAKLFEDVRNWAASQWHIQIPDPSPTWREEKSKK